MKAVRAFWTFNDNRKTYEYKVSDIRYQGLQLLLLKWRGRV